MAQFLHLSLVGIFVPVTKAVHEAGGIEALGEKFSNQTQVWEYNWSNVDYNEDNNDNDNYENE